MMTRTRTRSALLVASAAAGLITLSACGGGYGGAYGNDASPANQSQGLSQEAAPASGVTLAAAEVGALGQVVTDQNGLTLYRFDKDKAKPASVSNCAQACAKTWPPALGDPASVQLQGVDPALVGSVTREDGTEQLTLSGWPLYTYAKDTTAGDAKGQGVGKTWFAVTPKGKKAQVTSGSAPANTSNSAPAEAPRNSVPRNSAPEGASDSGYGSGYGSGGGY